VEIRKLQAHEWLPLIGVFDKTFGSDIGSPKHGTIVGVFEDGKIEAFLLMENIVMIDQVWSRTPKNNTRYIKSLIRWVRERVPETQTVATMSDGKRFEILFRLLGMQKIAGTFFRRNAK
jgi:hypothetical protein